MSESEFSEIKNKQSGADTNEKSDQALRESERNLRLLIESATDYAIFSLTEDGTISSWNSGAEKIFGYSEAEIIGRKYDILFTPQDRAINEPQRELQEAVLTGRGEDERWHIRKNGSRFFASGVVTCLSEASGSGFVKIARDMTEKKLAEKALIDKEILQKMVRAQELERKRIARDLHDHLGQQLTALRLKIEAAKKICLAPEFIQQIDESLAIVQSIDSDVDFLAWELRPAVLDDLGLPSALENYLKEWSKMSKISSDFYTAGSVNQVRFSPEIETNLYRIAQEALNNVYKHAKAANVNLILEQRGSLINLIIEDDGTGFDIENTSSNAKGIGLIGMAERANLIGGKIKIESIREQGTTIFVRIPITETDSQIIF